MELDVCLAGLELSVTTASDSSPVMVRVDFKKPLKVRTSTCEEVMMVITTAISTTIIIIVWVDFEKPLKVRSVEII